MRGNPSILSLPREYVFAVGREERDKNGKKVRRNNPPRQGCRRKGWGRMGKVGKKVPSVCGEKAREVDEKRLIALGKI